MTEKPIDVAAGLQAAFRAVSPEAQTLVARVLDIERENQHLSKPHVGKEIEKAVFNAVRGVKS